MAVTQAMLTAAENAYHDLMTGQAIVELRDQNGETMKYARAQAGSLRNYILELRITLNLNVSPSAPMQVWM